MTRKEKIKCNSDLKKVVCIENDLDFSSEFVTRLLKEDILIQKFFDETFNNNELVVLFGVNSQEENILIILDLSANIAIINDKIEEIQNKIKQIIKNNGIYPAKTYYLYIDIENDNINNVYEKVVDLDKISIHKYNVKAAYDYYINNDISKINEWDVLIMLNLNKKEFKDFSKREAFTLAFYEYLQNMNR